MVTLNPSHWSSWEQATYKIFKTKYWWPHLLTEINCYIAFCTVCTQAKVPCILPVSKLLTIPTPQCPRSHLGINSLTDLPKSKGHYVGQRQVLQILLLESSAKPTYSIWNSRFNFQIMCSDTMGSQRTLSVIVAPNSPPESGIISWKNCQSLSVSSLDTNQNPSAR